MVRRRHSAPIPNPAAGGGGALDWAGEEFVGVGASSSSSSPSSAAVPVKAEFHAQTTSKQSLDGSGGGGSGNALDSFSSNFLGTAAGMGGGAKWGGVGAPATAQMTDSDGAWWQQPQQQQAGAGGIGVGTSAAATMATDVATGCKFEPSFDDAANGNAVDAHGLTSTLTSTLPAVDL